MKFLLAVVLVYLAVAVFDFPYFFSALWETAKMFVRIVPIFGIVLVIMILVNLFLSSEKIKKHLGEGSGWKAWLYSIGAGILVSGPPYVLYPLLSELKKNGMKNSLLAVFLYNRDVKIPFLPVMIFYFGLPFTVVISTYIVLFSILNGILVGFFVDGVKR